MVRPVKYDYGTYVEGDTVDAVDFGIVRYDEGVADSDPLDGAKVRFAVKDLNKNILYEAKSTTTGISIDGNVVTVEPFYAPDNGQYTYNLQVKFSDGVRRTVVWGNFVTTTGVGHEE